MVDKNRHYYIVKWDIEKCRALMDKVMSTTLVTKMKTFKNMWNKTIIQVKV